MRKSLLLILIFITKICSLAQSDKLLSDSFNFLAKPDSFITKSKFGFIYTTNDTSSIIYKWLTPDLKNVYANYLYSDYIRDIKEKYHQSPINVDIKGCSRSWNPIHIYRNKYYLFGPCDWMENYGYYISDSIIYVTKSDPDLYFILEYKRINDILSEFQILDYNGDHEKIRIQLVDSKLGIYLWTFYNQKNEIIINELMQDSKFLKQLPTIVCDCGEDKCELELAFDDIDLNKLIK